MAALALGQATLGRPRRARCVHPIHAIRGRPGSASRLHTTPSGSSRVGRRDQSRMRAPPGVPRPPAPAPTGAQQQSRWTAASLGSAVAAAGSGTIGEATGGTKEATAATRAGQAGQGEEAGSTTTTRATSLAVRRPRAGATKAVEGADGSSQVPPEEERLTTTTLSRGAGTTSNKEVEAAVVDAGAGATRAGAVSARLSRSSRDLLAVQRAAQRRQAPAGRCDARVAHRAWRPSTS